jgi:hypothetical protein
MLELNTKLYHPCSIDIIEHKVVGVSTFLDSNDKTITIYRLKALQNVGACGRLEVEIIQQKDKFIFYSLINEDNIPHASGLQDFIEGNYYTDKEKARLEFYNMHIKYARQRVESLTKTLEQAKNEQKRIENIINVIKGSENNGH